jgi:hypothetical protein
MSGRASPLHPAVSRKGSRQDLAVHPPSRPSSPFARPDATPSAPLLIGKVKAELRQGVQNILVTGGAGFMSVLGRGPLHFR